MSSKGRKNLKTFQSNEENAGDTENEPIKKICRDFQNWDRQSHFSSQQKVARENVMNPYLPATVEIKGWESLRRE